jgi:hypothetical protein
MNGAHWSLPVGSTCVNAAIERQASGIEGSTRRNLDPTWPRRHCHFEEPHHQSSRRTLHRLRPKAREPVCKATIKPREDRASSSSASNLADAYREGNDFFVGSLVAVSLTPSHFA